MIVRSERSRSAGACSLLLVYLLGQILSWLGRRNVSDDRSLRWKRLFSTLVFRFPKPTKNYNEKLEPLLRKVAERLFPSASNDAEWRQIFPVAKNYLAQHSTSSLIATYQNKYTLHRSISLAAAAWFWVNLFGHLAGAISVFCGGPSPHYLALTIFSLISIILVSGFGESFLLHWEMFGNTIITESYAILFGPKDVEAKKE